MQALATAIIWSARRVDTSRKHTKTAMQFAYKVTDFKPNNMRETIRSIFYWILAGIVLIVLSGSPNSPSMSDCPDDMSVKTCKELVKNAVESIEGYDSPTI